MATIIQIEDYLISSEILSEYFVCDYTKCKGVCCVIGDSGAPLEKAETEDLLSNYKYFEKYLTTEGKKSISDLAKNGKLYVIDRDGDIVTPLVNQEECSFTNFDQDHNCYCAIEKAYLSRESDFRKPISCWLYPIRVSKLSGGMTALNLHRWTICTDAFKKGKEEKIKVYQFLKEPIIAAFGQELYNQIEAADCSIIRENL